MKPTARRLLNISLVMAAGTAAWYYKIIWKRLWRMGQTLRERSLASLAEPEGSPTAEEGDPTARNGTVKEREPMARWRKRVLYLANRAEARYDRLKNRLEERFSKDDPLKIASYRGYGTSEKLYLRGRVVEDKGIGPATDEDSIWRNLLNTYKRFESDEIPGARVRARFQGQEVEMVADEEGYFELWLEPTSPLPTDRLWHEVELELVEPVREGHDPVHTTGYILVPPPSARFGIISDVDDTVVHTNATSLLKMARTVFMGNARTRLPFEGVAAFYEALQGGMGGTDFNPLFYVSSSPWNLYDLLAEFLEIQEIPLGPIMLRDWGLSNDEVLPTKHGPHKLKSIRQILNTFPDLPFILIGDSGQEDPEIYYNIVKEYPERIQAIYIRNVSRDPARPESIIALAKEVTEAGSTLVLADDTLAAAKHAAEVGIIAAEVLPRVRVEKERDEARPEVLPTEEPTPTIIVEGDAQGDATLVVEEHPDAPQAPLPEQAEEIAEEVLGEDLTQEG